MQTNRIDRSRRCARPLGGLLAVGFFLAIANDGAAFPVELGEVQGNFDTTVSIGTTVRVSEPDLDIIGRENGGNAHSVNGDDGNLNYESGDFVSNTFKYTHELQLNWRNFDLFGRAFYFYDFQSMQWGSEDFRTPLTNEAKNEIGYDFKLLDAYGTVSVPLGGMYLTLRGGNQALNWGESTFIQNGINSMSTIDVSKLRVAGSELRDALEAIPMVSASLDLNDRFTLDAFYPFEWQHTEIEPQGSFFSTNDFASPGGTRVLLGFGEPGRSDTEPNFDPMSRVQTDVPRAADRDAKDGGEFGVALRWFEPSLAGTEFGFYYTRLHSRLPIISGVTGLLDGFVAADYASTANYFREFPEDIDTFGFSVSTSMPAIPFLSGGAFQAEASYKIDQPLQVDDVELLFAALSPIDEFAGFGPGTGFKLSQLAVANGGPFGFDEEISGYRRKDVFQSQGTFTKIMGPRFGADQWVFLTEAGVMLVQDMEDPEDLRYEAPGTYTSANPNPFLTADLDPGTPGVQSVQPATEDIDAFADDVSWGYRSVLRAEFNQFLGTGINIQPTLVWNHDVTGTSPSPILNYIEGRKAITAQIGADYRLSWAAKISYTNSFGGSRYNLLNDRDFVSATLSYAF